MPFSLFRRNSSHLLVGEETSARDLQPLGVFSQALERAHSPAGQLPRELAFVGGCDACGVTETESK